MSRLAVKSSQFLSASNLQLSICPVSARRFTSNGNFLFGVKGWDRTNVYKQNCKRWMTESRAKENKTTTTAAKEASQSTETSASPLTQMWNRFTGPKEMPERYTMPWYREMVLICTVFAITGSSTMIVVRKNMFIC